MRILYVDDDEILVRLVQRVLGRAGHEIRHAADAGRAIELAGAERFDAIVLDHYLQSGTGHDVLARLGAVESAPPVVYVTASSDATVAVEALKAGASDYVIKSGGAEFLAMLERAIGQSIESARLREEKLRADAETARARARAEALLSEMNHRVANSLAMVSSLLRLQIKSSEDDAVRQALSQTLGRISAIVNIHRSLYMGEDLRAVRLDQYLAALVEDFRQTFPDNVALVFEGDPIVASPDRAVSVGIIATELTTNASKYAFPDGRVGEVTIRLRADGEAAVTLSIADDGVGFAPSEAPKGTGLGQTIVRSMARGLGANLSIEARAPQGTSAVLRFDRE